MFGVISSNWSRKGSDLKIFRPKRLFAGGGRFEKWVAEIF